MRALATLLAACCLLAVVVGPAGAVHDTDRDPTVGEAGIAVESSNGTGTVTVSAPVSGLAAVEGRAVVLTRPFGTDALELNATLAVYGPQGYVRVAPSLAGYRPAQQRTVGREPGPLGVRRPVRAAALADADAGGVGNLLRGGVRRAGSGGAGGGGTRERREAGRAVSGV
jgi:hypothetical protein